MSVRMLLFAVAPVLSAKAFNALTLVKLKQYEVVGRKLPTEKNPRPELYKVGARCGTATPSSRFPR